MNVQVTQAPRITPQDIENNIVSENYFTAEEGILGAYRANNDVYVGSRPTFNNAEAWKLLTFCVLVLRNGFTVTGESACVSPENFNKDTGREVAYKNAVQKIWPLMGYALKEELHRQNGPLVTGMDLSNTTVGGIAITPEPDTGMNIDGPSPTSPTEPPLYQSFKTVRAGKISSIKHCISGGATLGWSGAGILGSTGVSAEYMEKHKPECGGYYVQYQDGYESYSPAAAFESGYVRKALKDGEGGLNFGQALHCLQAGRKVARADWNSKRKWLEMKKSQSGYMDIFMHDSAYWEWATKRDDILAKDWVVVP